MKVLITCGPTWVAIDDVRVISNRSTGAMGHALARGFHRAGAKVTLLEGPVVSPLTEKGIRVIKYCFFSELQKILTSEIKRGYDVCVHAAAVSDFQPAQASKGKIESGRRLNLNLVPTPKLISLVKGLDPDVFLVGFKLLPRMTRALAPVAARALIKQAQCDLVVANAVAKGYRGFIVDADGKVWAEAAKREQLAEQLVRLVK